MKTFYNYLDLRDLDKFLGVVDNMMDLITILGFY